MRLIIITISILMLTMTLWGQQNEEYSQFMNTKVGNNPSFAGQFEALAFTALYRHQWQGIIGAPRVMQYTAHGTVLDNRVGLGINIINDAVGLWETNQVKTSYAYRMELDDESVFSAGISLQVKRSSYDWTDAIVINDGDVNLPIERNADLNFNYGFGLNYSAEKYYVGLSIPNILNKKIDVNQNLPEGYQGTRNYYLAAGYLYDLSEHISLKPSLLISYIPNAPFDASVNLSSILFQKILLGLSYRLDDAASAVLQYKPDERLMIGVTADFTLSELKTYTTGSLEVMIQYAMRSRYADKGRIDYFE